MNGDLPTWLAEVVRPELERDAAGLLDPGFRADLGPIEIGRLLGRMPEGGLFALRRGPGADRGAVVEVSALAPGDADAESDAAFVSRVAGARHPGLSPLLAAGRAGSTRWVSLQDADGWTLRRILGRRGVVFGSRRLAGIGAELASALAVVHAEGGSFGLLGNRGSAGRVYVDRAGRVRLLGAPTLRRPHLPDAMGIGVVVACAALGAAPDPRGLTLATVRTLASALDRRENVARTSPELRRLVQSLLLLHPDGFLPSMGVLARAFAALMEGLPLHVADPVWGRALCEAVRGLTPGHQPVRQDAEAVLASLRGHLAPLLEALPVLPVSPESAPRPSTAGDVPLPSMQAAPPSPVGERSPEAPSREPAAPDRPGIAAPEESTCDPSSAPPPIEMPILPSLVEPEPRPTRSLAEQLFPGFARRRAG